MGKYEEALERAKELHEAGNALTKLQMEIVFPVLQESEDERLRKEIRNFLIDMECKKDWIAYLEEQKPAEWSEEDEFFRQQLIVYCDNCVQDSLAAKCVDWLKSLRPQPKQEWGEKDERKIVELKSFIAQCNGFNKANRQKAFELIDSLHPQPKQEEPLEIKYAEKIYKVYGTKELPGGVVGYIIEDEPGHYDCIIHPDEVLGGGYGIKSNGSPYPTKEVNFGQPHWKPSEEQVEILGRFNDPVLKSLYSDLKKLL